MVEATAVRPLRVGVVGLGFAGETHLKCYLQLPNVEVVAIADPNTQRLSSVGTTYMVPNLYARYEEMIARPDIDAVSVCTPNHLHAPVAIMALERRKHVLCEKPLARTGAEATAIVRAAKSAQRVLQVAFNHRARGDAQTLKRYVEAGSLGRIYHTKASWMRRSGIPGMGGWFTSREMAGGGPLIDLGVHVLDMALFLLGEPVVVSVTAATYAELGPRGRGSRNSAPLPGESGPFEVEDLATAFVRLADGGTLLLEASWAVYGSAGDDFGVTLFGTEGGAEINVQNYGWENTLRIFADVAGVPAKLQLQAPKGEGHLAVVRDFIAAVHGSNWDAHIGLEGLRRSLIIDACYHSSLEGREVLVDYPDLSA